jgi:membrane protein YqaA with SNARE-associated domain
MFKSLYQWTLSLAESRHAPWALGAVAFAESSFFPIPPDPLLAVMTIAKPKQAWAYASICTLASVAGGILGYAIGALLFETLGKWLIDLYGYGARVEELRAVYAHWGWAFILFKGLTPIPYKIVTITSGLLAYSLPLFIFLSLVTRGTRFFIAAVVLNRFGDNIRGLLEKYFALLMIGFIVVVIAGFFLAAHFI